MTKSKKILLKVLGAFLLFVIFIIWGVNAMGPGSYARAEYYVLNVPIDTKIKELKERYPQYRFIRTPHGKEPYEYEDKKDKKYFYSKEHSILFCCILRPNQNRLGLYAVFYDTEFRNGKSINKKDISSKENKRVKKIFETEILPKLGEWKYQRNAFMRFVGLY